MKELDWKLLFEKEREAFASYEMDAINHRALVGEILGRTEDEDIADTAKKVMEQLAACQRERDDLRTLNSNNIQSNLVMEEQLAAMIKERDEYKFMYEGLCK